MQAKSTQGKIITFYSHKGGVCKTTNCFTVASLLAQRKKDARILMIDLDSQCNLTQSFCVSTPEDKISFYGAVLQGKSLLPENCIQHDVYKNLFLAKGDEDQSICEEEFAFYTSSSSTTVTTREVMKNVNILKDARRVFDYVVIDMPPAFNRFCRMVLGVTDEWIISLLPDAFGANTMQTLSRRWTLEGSVSDYHIVNSVNEFNRKYGAGTLKATKARFVIMNKCKRANNSFAKDVLERIHEIEVTKYNHVELNSRKVFSIADFMSVNAFAHELRVPYILSETNDVPSAHRSAHTNNHDSRMMSREELTLLVDEL